MPRSILRILRWIFNPFFEPYVQRDWVPARFFIFCFFVFVLVVFCFFWGCYCIGHISLEKKNNPEDRHSMRRLLIGHSLHRVNQVQFRKIVEGMANPTLAHLVYMWYLSYSKYYIMKHEVYCCTPTYEYDDVRGLRVCFYLKTMTCSTSTPMSAGPCEYNM